MALRVSPPYPRHTVSGTRLTPSSALSFALHPRWTLNYLFRGKFELPNLSSHVAEGSNVALSVADYFNTMLDQSLDWKMAEKIRVQWGGQFCLKGIMSVEDAKGILSGGEDSATQYFRRTTSGPLGEKFKPVVQKAMAKVKLAEKYDQLAGKAAKFGLVREQDAHLENYVTQKTLDGLYLMIAEEEKAIRQDPAGAAGKLAKKVFGALK